MTLMAPHAHEGLTIQRVMFKVNLALIPAALSLRRPVTQELRG